MSGIELDTPQARARVWEPKISLGSVLNLLVILCGVMAPLAILLHKMDTRLEIQERRIADLEKIVSEDVKQTPIIQSTLVTLTSDISSNKKIQEFQYQTMRDDLRMVREILEKQGRR